ncbi:hypothetical protein L2E82_51706 [Cichorium intybus]|nr:hypothetical protein L2E82_51706 [Cichorium intybus]
MVFGKASSRSKDTETQQHEKFVDIEENEEESPSNSAAGNQRNIKKDSTMPLLEEEIVIGSGTSKNAEGAKVWLCNHCKVQYTRSYTRIHTISLGLKPGRRTNMNVSVYD